MSIPGGSHSTSGASHLGGAPSQRVETVCLRSARTNYTSNLTITYLKAVGKGTFGYIEKAQIQNHPDPVAVKKVFQDPRYKNRELGIMQKLEDHPNIIRFIYYFYSNAPRGGRHSNKQSSSNGNNSSSDIFLNLIVEYFPESLCDLLHRHSQRGKSSLPPIWVKLFSYQMLRALSYVHSLDICHRDIKSSNLLVDENTLRLKLCDFGSAKEMVPDAANVSYISSRYYRAPELLFGAQVYTCSIDIWSAGCVTAEMLRMQCLFMGTDSVDQLVKVIRVLGTPCREDVLIMNPQYAQNSFPQVAACPMKLFFPRSTPSDLLRLLSEMLVYRPEQRVKPLRSLTHQAFDELRAPNFRLPSGAPPPPLFDFTLNELAVEPTLKPLLMPKGSSINNGLSSDSVQASSASTESGAANSQNKAIFTTV